MCDRTRKIHYFLTKEKTEGQVGERGWEVVDGLVKFCSKGKMSERRRKEVINWLIEFTQ